MKEIDYFTRYKEAIKLKISNKLLWYLSILFFIFGATLPMFSFRSFLIFNDTFSLLGGIIHLLKEGELLLFLLIMIFSIGIPAYKMYLSGKLLKINTDKADDKVKNIKRLMILSKWSMADVFVVAIIAATVKMGMLASVDVHAGLFLFGLAVLTSMWLVHRQMFDFEIKLKSRD